MKRSDGRGPEALRPVKITRNYLKHAEGSVLIEMGDTKVICSASVEERVPSFYEKLERGGLRRNIRCCLAQHTPVLPGIH